MRASVVIRTFNSEHTIRRVLDGVSMQAFGDYEIVVVDSGSTDGTLEIVREYPHVFVDYTHTRFTYSGSLNAGCAVARGEYIVCLSSHTIPLHGDWLGALVGALDADERVAAAWGPLIFDVEDFPIGKKDGVELIDLERFLRRPNQGLQNPNSIIRRKLWMEYPFSETVPTTEDQDWAYHFLKLGYNTAMVYGASAFYGIQHSPVQYGKKMAYEFMVLHESYGFRPNVSTVELCRRTVRLAGAVVLGKKSPRTSALAIASLAGRWSVDQRIRYREISDLMNIYREGGPKALAKRAIIGADRRLNGRIGAGLRRIAASQAPVSAPGLEGKTRFFLVGEMRSGTSWLARTLDTHPEVFCKGEGSFFGRDQAREEIPVLTGPSPSLYNALAECEGFRTWHSLLWNGWGKSPDVEDDILNLTRMTVNYFLAKDSAASGKRIVGDKSPLHTDHVDEIFAFFPRAKVIHILRDGRDVAVSLMHHFWRVSVDRGGIFELDQEELAKRDAYLEDPEGFLRAGNSIFTEERLGQMAVRWSRRVSKASQDGTNLFGDNFAQLRYEDLLERPEENLKTLLELLGAGTDDRTVRRCVEQNNFERLARRSRGQEDAGSFFRKGIAGDWRGVFTKRDREIYQEIAGDTLREMGYPLD
jgi:glycosyltransferase involved in cell wall biosynthesis